MSNYHDDFKKLKNALDWLDNNTNGEINSDDREKTWLLILLATKLSQAAYLPQGELKRLLAANNLKGEVFEGEGEIGQSLQCLYIETEKHVWLSFRGTNNLKNVVTDALISQTDFYDNGKVHLGFYKAWKSIKNATYRQLDLQNNQKRITLTGHSLGGSLAHLAAFELAYKEKANVGSLITVGQPAVGDKEFAKQSFSLVFQKNSQTRQYFRVYYYWDPVVYLPPSGTFVKIRWYQTGTKVQLQWWRGYRGKPTPAHNKVAIQKTSSLSWIITKLIGKKIMRMHTPLSTVFDVAQQSKNHKIGIAYWPRLQKVVKKYIHVSLRF